MSVGAAGSRGLILAMDGSTGVSTAAVLTRQLSAAAGRAGDLHADGRAAEGWQVLTRRADRDSRGQARVLLRQVDDMLREIGRHPEDVAAIVVGVGPGTFTGVRIAVATGRALALALPTLVLGVSTLGALAAAAVSRVEEDGAEERPGLIMPVVDARRGQVFYGVYRASPTGLIYARDEAFGVCDRGELTAQIAASKGTARVQESAGAGGGLGRGKSRVWVVGQVEVLPAGGADREDQDAPVVYWPMDVAAEHLLRGQGRLREPGEAIEGGRLIPWIEETLSGRARGAWEAFRAGDLGSPEAVKPVYIRPPDADIHITKMKDPWADPGAER